MCMCACGGEGECTYRESSDTHPTIRSLLECLQLLHIHMYSSLMVRYL